MHYLTRRLNADLDISALQDLWRATWRDTYGPILGSGRMHLVDEAAALPAVRTMFAQDGGGFVVVEDGAVVGSVCFAERHRVGHVWGMYVHPGRQRRGAGTALLRQAARAMFDADRVELSATTAASVGFYRRLGFVEGGTYEFELFPDVACAAMRLTIPVLALRRAETLIPPA